MACVSWEGGAGASSGETSAAPGGSRTAGADRTVRFTVVRASAAGQEQWEQRYDRHTARAYYVDRQSGYSRWDRPETGEIIVSEAEASRASRESSKRKGALHVQRELLMPAPVLEFLQERVLSRLPRRCTRGDHEWYDPQRWRWYDPRGWPVAFGGFIVCGLLFIPFSFAVLQESLSCNDPVELFSDQVRPMHTRAWWAALVFLGSASLMTIIIFNLDPLGDARWYEPGSTKLSILLVLSLLPGFVQQLITFRYIGLRPELSIVVKSGRKYPLCCGAAYSSMNPRNWVNYIYASIIVAEFAQFAAILFGPNMPWLAQGSRDQDENAVEFLNEVLPNFLAGRLDEIQLGLLLSATTVYVIAMGFFLYLKMTPTDLACNLLAGTFYVPVVSRLLGIASLTTMRDVRTMCLLALLMYMATATFAATLVGADVTPNSDVSFMPKWLVLERTLKGTLGIVAVLFRKADPLWVLVYSILLNVLLIMMLDTWKTCSVTFVTRTRIALLLVMFYMQLITLMMLLLPWEGWFILLLAGTGLGFAALIAAAIYKIFYTGPPEDEPEAPIRSEPERAPERTPNPIRAASP